MTVTERKLGYAFGLLGGGLTALAGLFSLVLGAVDLATGRMFGALASGTAGIALLVVGGLALLFAYLAYRDWSDRPLVAGVLLVVLAAISWALLGLGGNVLSILGGIFVFLAGVLFMVGPVRTSVSSAATS
ncbi:MAG TPA: hypothetical protein VGV89_01170 [Thermoplasmata archaeon]|nr:hypothetical protein [Thermoplasmata archaeon]